MAKLPNSATAILVGVLALAGTIIAALINASSIDKEAHYTQTAEAKLTITQEVTPPPLEIATTETPIPALIEEFNNPNDFTYTDPNIFIDEGMVVWNFDRSGGEQFAYREIQSFSGDIRLTVIGKIDDWTGNCRVGAGIGDAPGSGVAVYFGYHGSGCSQQGSTISAGGITTNFTEESCNYIGQWPWIESGRPYSVTIVIEGT